MDTVFKVILDIYEVSARESISIKQGDTSKKLLVSLCAKGKPYKIPENSFVAVNAVLDGRTFYKECTISNNEIECGIDFVSQFIGVHDLEISIHKDDKVLLTQSITVKVYPSAYADGEGEVVASDAFSALTAMVSEGRTLIDDINEMVSNGELKGAKVHYIDTWHSSENYQKVGNTIDFGYIEGMTVGDIVIERSNGRIVEITNLYEDGIGGYSMVEGIVMGYIPLADKNKACTVHHTPYALKEFAYTENGKTYMGYAELGGSANLTGDIVVEGEGLCILVKEFRQAKYDYEVEFLGYITKEKVEPTKLYRHNIILESTDDDRMKVSIINNIATAYNSVSDNSLIQSIDGVIVMINKSAGGIVFMTVDYAEFSSGRLLIEGLGLDNGTSGYGIFYFDAVVNDTVTEI